jgi:predicted  nucleic acid-binding Zn-ribbon protein
MSKCHFSLLSKSSIIFPALFMALLIAGCGPNVKEKNRLTADIEYIRAVIDKEIIQSNKILSELNDYRNKLSNLEDKKSLKEIEKAKCQHDLRKYVLNHKTTTLGLITAGIYAEYAEILAKLVRYTDQLSNINDVISRIDNRIYELKRKIGLLKEKHNDYEESIDALKAKLREKLERYNSL